MKKLASLMKPADSTDPTFHVRRTLTTALGLPLATAQMRSDDVQGSLGYYFHEGIDKNGKPSDKVLGLSCAHVLRANTTVDYEYAGERTGAPKQKVRVCGFPRFQQTIQKTTDLIGTKVEEVIDLATEIAALGTRETKEGKDEAREAELTLTCKMQDLKRLKQDNVILERFLKDLTIDWANTNARNIGYVDYAPKIDVRVDDCHYTRDLATFKLEETKFRDNFIGNVVDLGLCRLYSFVSLC